MVQIQSYQYLRPFGYLFHERKKLEGKREMFKCIKKLFKKEVVELPLYFKVAVKEIGQKELNGSLHNPRIIEYHKCTSLQATTDEIPWCASFVNWCLYMSATRGTNSARARSFLDLGIETDEPRKGDIVVFWRGSPYAKSGHVSFFVEHINDKWIRVLGGNQANKVCYQDYPIDRVLSYRRIYVEEI